jgi:hypothetical protein
MDTRSKILTLAEARQLTGRVAVDTGTFNPMRAECARELEDMRTRAGPDCLLVVVLPADPELLPQNARVELVAALRTVDRVSAATPAEAEDLIRCLQPVEVMRLEAVHAGRTRELIEHVRLTSNAALRAAQSSKHDAPE